MTAKTITRTVAEEAFEILRSKGLKFKSVTITAKDKICPFQEAECNPDSCPYAKGHYDLSLIHIYTSLPVVPQYEHIFGEEENAGRLPERVRNSTMRVQLFDGEMCIRDSCI